MRIHLPDFPILQIPIRHPEIRDVPRSGIVDRGTRGRCRIGLQTLERPAIGKRKLATFLRRHRVFTSKRWLTSILHATCKLSVCVFSNITCKY